MSATRIVAALTGVLIAIAIIGPPATASPPVRNGSDCKSHAFRGKIGTSGIPGGDVKYIRLSISKTWVRDERKDIVGGFFTLNYSALSGATLCPKGTWQLLGSNNTVTETHRFAVKRSKSGTYKLTSADMEHPGLPRFIIRASM